MTSLTWFLWISNICCDTLGQVAFKYAAISPSNRTGIYYWIDLFKRPWLWVGIGSYLLEFPLWLAFLSTVPLSQGILLGSVNIIAIMLVGRILFQEHLTRLRVLGISLIAIGVAIVGVS